MQSLFVGSETARTLRAGPLGERVGGFVEVLASAGYEPASIQAKVLVAAQLGSWLERRGLGVRDLEEARVRDFLHWRRRRYRAHRGTEATLMQLLHHLRTTGELPPAVVSLKRGAAALMEEHYTAYL